MSDTKIMQEMKSSFNEFTNLVDRDIKGVHIGCYSVALISFAIAIRKVRPFTKLKRPKDVPNHFIQEKRELLGTVERIEPSGGGILMVEHRPLVNIPLMKSGQLPVKISGVKVTGLGLNWLQTIVSGKDIKFVPVVKEKDFVQCQVLLIQNAKEKKELLNVGEHLLKIGFGQTEVIQRPLIDDPSFLVYYRKLKSAENYALRKRLGFKYYIEPTKQALQVLMVNVNNLLAILLKLVKKQMKSMPKLSPA